MQTFATKSRVPEQVKQLDKLFGSQVKQFDAKVHAVHLDGLNISAVYPTVQGQVLVVTLRVIVLSHVIHYEILFGLHVLQLEIGVQRTHFDRLTMSYTYPSEHGQIFNVVSNPVEVTSQVRQTAGLLGSHVLQFDGAIHGRHFSDDMSTY